MGLILLKSHCVNYIAEIVYSKIFSTISGTKQMPNSCLSLLESCSDLSRSSYDQLYFFWLYSIQNVMSILAYLQSTNPKKLWKPHKFVTYYFGPKKQMQTDIRLCWVFIFPTFIFLDALLDISVCFIFRNVEVCDSGVLPQTVLEELCVHPYYLSKIWKILNPKIHLT